MTAPTWNGDVRSVSDPPSSSSAMWKQSVMASVRCERSRASSTLVRPPSERFYIAYLVFQSTSRADDGRRGRRGSQGTTLALALLRRTWWRQQCATQCANTTSGHCTTQCANTTCRLGVDTLCGSKRANTAPTLTREPCSEPLRAKPSALRPTVIRMRIMGRRKDKRGRCHF